MTVTTLNAAITPVAGDGATTAFTVDFQFRDSSELLVYLRTSATGAQVLQTETTHYSVTGGSGLTGTVTFVTAPVSTVEVHIIRSTARTQQVDITNPSTLPSAPIEEQLDRSVMLDQEDAHDILKALRAPLTDSAALDMELPSSVDRASKVLGFDSSGNPVATTQADQSALTVIATGSTTARTHAERWSERKNVKDYGAIGNGVADDTAAIQAAIDAAETVTIGEPGGEVFFPEGKYLHTALVVDASNVWLTGVGGDSSRLIKTTATGWGVTFGDGSTVKRRGGIEKLSFGQNGVASAGGAILLDKVDNITIRDVLIDTSFGTNTPYVGIRVQTGCFRTELVDVEVTACVLNGIEIVDCLGTGMYRVRSGSNGTNGMLLDACQALFAVTVSLFGNDVGAKIQNDSASSYNSKDQWWLHAAFDTSDGHNCHITGLKTSHFIGCSAASIGTSSNANGAGWFLDSSAAPDTDIRTIRFSGCLATDNNKHGMELKGCRDIQILGSDFNTNGSTTVSGSAGISLDDCNRVVISGNGFTFQQQYAIAMTGGTPSQKLTVVGNSMEDNATAAFLETTRPTLSIFEHNNTGDSQPSVATDGGDITLPAWSKFIDVTGTLNVTSMTGGHTVGHEVTLHFTGTAGSTGMTDGSNLKLAGNFVYTPDDTMTLVFDGTNWIEVSRSVN